MFSMHPLYIDLVLESEFAYKFSEEYCLQITIASVKCMHLINGCTIKEQST